MSYCRFSTDDYRSDVYVYDSCERGTRIDVAGNRYVTGPVRPPDGASIQDWIDAQKMKPIGLANDGASFNCATHAEAADVLQSLKDEGYYLPGGVIEELRSAKP